MELWQAQQKAGNARIGLGLMNAFASFGLFITRKNNGETALQWLGSDDYFVMSSLMVGGLLMAWNGWATRLAGESLEIEKTSADSYVRVSRHTPVEDVARQSLEERHHLYLRTAYRTAVAASLVFFAMSFYAFLGGFNNTPTPESHIGPHQDNNMELSVFCLLYGITGLLSMATCAVYAGKLSTYASPKTKI